MADYSDIFWTSADGLTLYARDYAAADDAPVLLMMHGLTRNSADFEGLADALAGRYRMIVPDQRGRGRSQYDADPANYQPAAYVKDMWQLVVMLGLPRFTIIGTSMGGLMAMIMGATRPEMISGIILNDIGPVVDTAGIERIKSYVGKAAPVACWADAAAASKVVNAVAFPDFNDDDWMDFARRTYRENEQGIPVAAYDPAIADGLTSAEPTAVPPDLWPLFGMLANIPMLVVRGGLSDLLSAETVTEMAARHPKFTTLDIPNRGHAPILDEADAVKAIEHFLAGLT